MSIFFAHLNKNLIQEDYNEYTTQTNEKIDNFEKDINSMKDRVNAIGIGKTLTRK
jgi:hypothetical protein